MIKITNIKFTTPLIQKAVGRNAEELLARLIEKFLIRNYDITAEVKVE